MPAHAFREKSLLRSYLDLLQTFLCSRLKRGRCTDSLTTSGKEQVVLKSETRSTIPSAVITSPHLSYGLASYSSQITVSW